MIVSSLIGLVVSPKTETRDFQDDTSVLKVGRTISEEDCVKLFERIHSLGEGGGNTSVYLSNVWTGNLRWARNRITTAGDAISRVITITRNIRGAESSASTNQFDIDSIKVALRTAERKILYRRENPDAPGWIEKQEYLKPDIWSEPTFNLDASARSKAARELVQPAADAGVQAAGYAEVRAVTTAVINNLGLNAYFLNTRAEYSVTVRDPVRSGSGWAGVDKFDWTSIDSKDISDRALEKCFKSRDPKGLEPGRYNTILEPQAVHDIMAAPIDALDRPPAEQFFTAYTLRHRQSKIGLRIFDERITISSDPMDPECGFVPFNNDGVPYRPVKWIENGVLKELAYPKLYAITQLGHDQALPNSRSYRMSGGTSTVEEMISRTTRGILLTRLSHISVMDSVSMLQTGVTRDGLWLIENGKITFPVKNMRFAESPFFIFNNLIDLGIPTRVYAANPVVVPAASVRDFNFVSLADAV